MTYNNMIELKRSAITCLSETIELLDSINNAELYTKVSNMVPGSTIGKHIRHCIDHFSCLIENQQKDQWTINYDNRRKQVEMEVDMEVVKKSIKSVIDQIQALSNDLDQPLIVISTINSNEIDSFQSKSSLGRELWFCIHHTIHHHALIKVICFELEIPTKDAFGIAPSTIMKRSLSKKSK